MHKANFILYDRFYKIDGLRLPGFRFCYPSVNGHSPEMSPILLPSYASTVEAMKRVGEGAKSIDSCTSDYSQGHGNSLDGCRGSTTTPKDWAEPKGRRKS